MTDAEFLAEMQAKFPKHVKVGKVTGRVQLSGPAKLALRQEVWNRSKGRCENCGKSTYWEARFEGDPDSYEMDHIKTRGSGGGDILSNNRVLCGLCHRKRHSAMGI